MHDRVMFQIRNRPDIEFLYEADDGELSSGQKRFNLTHRARGEYISFVDDDDDLSRDYVNSIYSEMQKDCTDVISFNLQMTINNKKLEAWKLLLCENGRNNRHKGEMMVNHLCAWRRELAIRSPWCPDLGYQDDSLWVFPLVHSGHVESHVHIDKTLYQYIYFDKVTENQKPLAKKFTNTQYLKNGIRCFLKDQEILLEVPVCGSGYKAHNKNTHVCVRNWLNEISIQKLSSLHHYYTVGR